MAKAKKVGGDENDGPRAIVPVEVQEIEPMSVSPTLLRERMELETERRQVLTDYISANMKEGTDYGQIEFKDKFTGEVKGKSKPTLFKPGAEKFCSLFGLQATFNKDFETWEMLGSQNGVVAFVCQLKTKNGVMVGEGRGVADIREKVGWTANNCVKIAEKRAQIDAVLRSGGLSDFFTQDLEDMQQQTFTPTPANRALPAQPVAGGAPMRTGRITAKQIPLVFKLLSELGLSKEKFEAYLLKNFNVIGVENIPFDLASKVIDMLMKQSRERNQKPAPAPQEDVPTIQLEEEDENAGHVEDLMKEPDL